MLSEEAQVTGVLGQADIPEGIGITYRENETKRYIFIGNFSDEDKCVTLSKHCVTEIKKYRDILTETELQDEVCLEAYGIVILEEDI